ncbi:MAG TPA: DNA repair protein RadC [Longimicrobium sp.]|jgi:DNA repair protein RadC|uniref:RadC family protein n=1 Tax=Longimicrobium sp. TaxID=2029185 RepID=UPI002EDB3135
MTPPRPSAPPRFSPHAIKRWPNQERPRERMLALGARALSARELLALIIETGSAAKGGRPALSAMDLAGSLLTAFAAPTGEESLRRIAAAPLAALCEVPGIGAAKASKVRAALELGRRLCEEARPDRECLRTARDVYERMRLVMRDLQQEELHALLLNPANQLLRDVVVARGTADEVKIHPRDVFRPALAEGAAKVVLVHNHPTGVPTPSPEDREITRRVLGAGRTMGITLQDHIIVGEASYYSFSEEGLMSML